MTLGNMSHLLGKVSQPTCPEVKVWHHQRLKHISLMWRCTWSKSTRRRLWWSWRMIDSYAYFISGNRIQFWLYRKRTSSLIILSIYSIKCQDSLWPPYRKEESDAKNSYGDCSIILLLLPVGVLKQEYLSCFAEVHYGANWVARCIDRR